jgi:hypothetical protein
MLPTVSRSQHVKDWRKNTKLRIIDSMGKKCQCCGYSACYQALDLHHINPKFKEISFGQVIANPKKWDTIVCELRKCILVCSNCHREIHAGIRPIPKTFTRFDESFANYKPKVETHDACPICGKQKPKQQLTCSYKCAHAKRGCVDWDKINLPELKKTLSNTQIGQMFGVSESAVRKRLLKMAPASGNAPD